MGTEHGIREGFGVETSSALPFSLFAYSIQPRIPTQGLLPLLFS